VGVSMCACLSLCQALAHKGGGEEGALVCAGLGFVWACRCPFPSMRACAGRTLESMVDGCRAGLPTARMDGRL